MMYLNLSILFQNLKKTHRKTIHQGWDNKARKYGKNCINLHEDQTAFEAVTFEGRNVANQQKYVKSTCTTKILPPTL